MRHKKILAAVATFAVAIGFSAPALAAYATTAVNVRDTPGGRIVDVLRTGEEVEIVGRSGSWCEVERPGADGYVACRYLSDRGRGRDRDRDFDDDDDFGRGSPDVSVSFSIPGFSFSIGDGDFDRPRPSRPDRPGRGDQVCFYEHVNYGGDSFCARPGERIRSLGAWNDRISSIRVRGFAEAQVCEHNGFRGRCVVIDRSVRNLGRGGNDIISSIRVR